MSNYWQLSFDNLSPLQQEILIATLSEQGFDGFEEKEGSLLAYIPANHYQADLIKGMLPDTAFSCTLIPSTNWNQQWESGFEPVIIDEFVCVRASFHEPIAGIQHDIIITPKMSFGTGHHATTSMMMRQMKSFDFVGRKVGDFGTGTGILAILAEKLGAKTIIAVDNDAWSIDNARENIEGNECLSITLNMADCLPASGDYDFVLANITKNIILENFEFMSGQLNKNGILLLSGLLEDDLGEILDKSRENRLVLIKKLQEGNWLSLSFLR